MIKTIFYYGNIDWKMNLSYTMYLSKLMANIGKASETFLIRKLFLEIDWKINLIFTTQLEKVLRNFFETKKVPERLIPISEHSKIPISTHFIRNHWCLFWLLGFTWETGQTSLFFFEVYTFYQDILCIT